MNSKDTMCFKIFRECVRAIHDGELIVQESQKDKEFHFQNWCQKRLENVGLHFEGTGRNIYPDFCLVEKPEGYEIKGLAYPGREKDYDANSNILENRPSADAYIVAKGKFLGATVVTAEEYKPNSAQLPNLCQAMGVHYIGYDDFMEAVSNTIDQE